MTQIKAIIFDLGKVVFDLSFDRVFQSWADSPEKSFKETESKIYEIALDYLKLKANQTLFLDDHLNNINGAKNI